MTCVELYDRAHIANVCAMLANPPDRVILVGEKYKTLEKYAARYREVLAERGNDVEIICASVNKNNISAIIELLSSFVEKYDDCHFDLTGGEDLLLCAAGIVYERYRQKGIHVNMHRFNIRSNRVVDCDLDGRTIAEGALPFLRVDENIAIWGGRVIGESTCSCCFSDDDRRDIFLLWDICRADVKAWNRQVNINAAAQRKKKDLSRELHTSALMKSMNSCLTYDERSHLVDTAVLEKLKENKLIKYYRCEGGLFEIGYKNTLVRRCLTKAGLVLELVVLLCADMALDSSGERVYFDSKSSILIDWDGDTDTRSGHLDAENEIDVMLMHGALPVFISCKNGDFDIEELYKLNSVSMRFGREYAKKIIISTALDSMGSKAKHIRERATDMDIRIIDDAHLISHKELIDKIGKLWM